MSVPEQVRKQSEEVQKLYADLNEPNPDGSPEEGELLVKPVGDPASTPAPTDSVNEPAPTPDANEPTPGEPEDFEQKYLSLQGMYNADVPRLTAENQALAARLTQMEGLIATMQTAPVPEVEPETPAASLLTAEEVEEYGESIDIMRKVSQEIVGPYQDQIITLETTIAELRGQIVPRVEQLASQQTQTAEQLFWSNLLEQAPDWREINDSQDFQTWLLEIDPLSGLTKQTYLEDAQRQLDAPRVAGFFNSWAKATGTVVVQPSGDAPLTELEKQVVPGKAHNTGAPEANTPKTWTRLAIAAFFTDVRLGKYKDKEEERNLLERDILAAPAEGRIVNA